MWNAESILSFIHKRLDAVEQNGQGQNEEETQMLRSAKNGELFALADLSLRLEPGDNPYSMLAKLREARERAPQELDGDDIASFQFVQVCLEVSGLVRNYLDEIEMNISTQVSINPLL